MKHYHAILKFQQHEIEENTGKDISEHLSIDKRRHCHKGISFKKIVSNNPNSK